MTVVSLGLAATPAAAATARGIDRACPPDEVPEDGFTDVPPTNGHEAAVDCVVWWKVALGRSPSTYDPGAAVQRGEMASFLARLILEAGGELPSTERAPDAFTDDNGSTHETTTNQLAAAGVVAGTGGGRFDPAGSVTRAQMASFLVQALEYRTGTGLPAGPDAFADDNGTTHEVNINKAAAAGLTGGTASGGYDGDLPIRRDQLASFLARSLDLLVEQGWAARPGVAYIEPTHGDVCDPETGQCRAVPL
ncbi:MAG TPA: S-layer homology domain-containing protein [Acidimicrobiales bacterium]|nr:S-layer homology domain-containing protein [Acidimicrobiales bacterium]